MQVVDILALDPTGRRNAIGHLIKDVNEVAVLARYRASTATSSRYGGIRVALDYMASQPGKCVRGLCGAVHAGSGDSVLCLACALRLRDA